jgi:hypothetical protein
MALALYNTSDFQEVVDNAVMDDDVFIVKDVSNCSCLDFSSSDGSNVIFLMDGGKTSVCCLFNDGRSLKTYCSVFLLPDI